MQQAVQRPASPPVVARLPAKGRIARIVVTVALPTIWLCAVLTLKQGLSTPDAVWAMFMVFVFLPDLLPWNQFLRMDDAGIAWRLGLGLKGQASWADVTEIIEKYGGGWKYKGWGVAVQTCTGEVFIPDRFTLKRPALADMLTDRWQAALASAPRSRVNG